MAGLDAAGYLRERKAWVDESLDAALPPADAPPEAVHAAMRHAVLNGGKRLRPVVALAAAEAAGADPRGVMGAARAIECVHTASLILDDLPCMDDAKQRRGAPCTHIEYGAATALLATMNLLSKAFEEVAENAAALGRPETAGPASAVLAAAIGDQGLVHGQHLDLRWTGGAPNLAELERIHQFKAGALFQAALAIPAILLDMPPSARVALARYGRDLGMAFQITDDLLDAANDQEDAGKTTFATHLGARGARERADALTQSAIAALDAFDGAAEPLRMLAELLRVRNA